MTDVPIYERTAFVLGICDFMVAQEVRSQWQDRDVAVKSFNARQTKFHQESRLPKKRRGPPRIREKISREDPVFGGGKSLGAQVLQNLQ